MKNLASYRAALLWTAALSLVIGYAALSLLASRTQARRLEPAPPAASAAAGSPEDTPVLPTPIM